jgi:competence protein ComEC
MFRACLLLLAGGFAAQHSRVLLGSDQCMWLFVATAILVTNRRTRNIALLVLGFALFMRAGYQVVEARLEHEFAGESMLAQVRVTEFPKLTGSSVSLLLEPVADARLPARSRVTWFEPPRVPALGEVWELELRLRRPRGLLNAGVFNLENWMFRENLHASGYVVPGKRNRLLESATLGGIDAARLRFTEFVDRNGGESSSVLVAIGVGSRHLISRSQWDRYAKTGTSHLMAISGLHIGLAATSAFLFIAILSGGLQLGGNHLNHGMIGGAIVAFAYALISGFAVPSQRAVMMLGLLAVTFIKKRRPDPVRIISLVAILVFIVDPVSVMKPGFSLSFAAVVVLLWGSSVYRQRPAEGRRLTLFLNTVRELTIMQGALLFGLMPLTVLLFQRIAFFAPAVNLVAVPVFSFVTVPLTLMSLLLHRSLDSISARLLDLAAESIQVLEKVIHFSSTLPMADLSIASHDLNILIILLPVLWVILPRGWPVRWVAILGALAIVLHKPLTPAPSCFDVHVLDVGQGLAVVVQSDQRTLLFDTGAAYRGGGSVAEQVILPFLRYKGIDAIDWLVVSHGDNDHAGGVRALLGGIPVSNIFLGEPARDLGRGADACFAGHAWRADGIDYRFLHPSQDSLRDGNNSSCVLSIAAGAHSVLLTGDIEAPAEGQILARSAALSSDIVVIPHHGSLTSSSPAFVNRVRPGLAIASAGFANRWGFPRERVIRRWEGIGAGVLDTATQGGISLQVCALSGISHLQGQRQIQRRFWHDPATQ